ncbi:MAG: LEA type 2 family protein [Balneolaceae bacterium]
MKKQFLIPVLIISVLAGCSTLRDLSDIQEPTVSYRDVNIQSISFDGITLLFDFDVTNPNRFGVTAEEYRYEFFINNRSFLSGEQPEQVSIGREESTVIQVPVSLNFSEIAQTFGSVVRGDSISYQLSTEVEFDLPVAGRQRVPVEAGGHFPLPKIPRIEFGGFEVKQMSFTGAEIEVSIRVTNPNSFGISLSGADYQLEINGNEWLDTFLDQSVDVDGSESKTVVIPISLNASQLGSAMREIVMGNRDLQYHFTGEAEISADIEGFEGVQYIPFDLSGNYRLD